MERILRFHPLIAFNDRRGGGPRAGIPPLIFGGAFFCVFFIFMPATILAGPPFVNDDPETVEYRHWEMYLAAQYSHGRDAVSSTLPHFEVNHGVIPNVQLHVIAPLVYVKPQGLGSQYGYGDTELGVKWRFIRETVAIPQVGIFPMIEFPTGDAAKGLGNGRAQYFLPVWIQKSFGPWTTYGGGGYWINPGAGRRNRWQFGWLLQRQIVHSLAVGAEIFHFTASSGDGDASTGCTLGAMIDISESHHLLLSAGRDFHGPGIFSAYVGYQYTFGPQRTAGGVGSPRKI